MPCSYYLFKLQFTDPVHFGEDIPGVGLENTRQTAHADTVFSALCHTILRTEGEAALENFLRPFQEGRPPFRLSDLLPWKGERLYLPKPAHNRRQDPEQSQTVPKKTETPADERKILKKMTHLPVESLESFYNGHYTLQDANKLDFIREQLDAKVSVSRLEDEDSKPFWVAANRFKCRTDGEDAGLALLVQVTDNSWIDRLRGWLEILAWEGVGGKRSIGYGRFKIYNDYELADPTNPSDKALFNMLDPVEKADVQKAYAKTFTWMSLSILSPNDADLDPAHLEDIYYQLIPRQGYTHEMRRRKSVMMFDAGALSSQPWRGRMLDVSPSEGKPCFRYGYALPIGINNHAA